MPLVERRGLSQAVASYDIDSAGHIAFGGHRAAETIEARAAGVEALPDVMTWPLCYEGELGDDWLQWHQASWVKRSVVVNAGYRNADVEPVLLGTGNRVDGEGMRGILRFDAGHRRAIYRDRVAQSSLRLVVKVIEQC